MLAESLNIFRAAVPSTYVGQTLAESRIRKRTGCNVIAVCNQGGISTDTDPSYRFRDKDELIVIGPTEAERLFF